MYVYRAKNLSKITSRGESQISAPLLNMTLRQKPVGLMKTSPHFPMEIARAVYACESASTRVSKAENRSTQSFHVLLTTCALLFLDALQITRSPLSQSYVNLLVPARSGCWLSTTSPVPSPSTLSSSCSLFLSPFFGLLRQGHFERLASCVPLLPVPPPPSPFRRCPDFPPASTDDSAAVAAAVATSSTDSPSPRGRSASPSPSCCFTAGGDTALIPIKCPSRKLRWRKPRDDQDTKVESGLRGSMFESRSPWPSWASWGNPNPNMMLVAIFRRHRLGAIPVPMIKPAFCLSRCAPCNRPARGGDVDRR